MTSRQSRPSEKVFDTILCDIRNIDKLLWNGDRRSLHDLEEHVYCVKRDLDEMVKKFKEETEEQWLREKAEIENQRIVTTDEPTIKGNKEEAPPESFGGCHYTDEYGCGQVVKDESTPDTKTPTNSHDVKAIFKPKWKCE